MTPTPAALTRSFFDLPTQETTEAEESEFLLHLSGDRAVTWEQLLQSDRVLIVSEAGAGKTHECREQQARLFTQGQPAFYLELASLANSTPEAQFSPAEQARYEEWKAAQSERAFFFLDSIDELRLTAHGFEVTLKRLHRALGANLSRACIVLTTRPGGDDRAIVARQLPVPDVIRHFVAEEAFADVAMRVDVSKNVAAQVIPRTRYVALAPLDSGQMRALAIDKGVSDSEALLAAIEAEHAEEFTRRPLDFIDLCADWNAHRRIRTYRDQLESSIAAKLSARARHERKEVVDLTPERAREGVERLALAALMTRKLMLWYDAETGRGRAEEALDPTAVLTDWNPAEIQALLERALFGFASYGRVRFHNRSVIEYLAASRLHRLKQRGLRISTLERLLFVTSPVGLKLVRPTMQPVAAWLATRLDPIREEMLARDPSLLLRFGDPGAMSPEVRTRALARYVAAYGHGGWRGIHVPALQARRLANTDLASTIQRLWGAGIENAEVRETLLELIEAGRIRKCADIAFEAALDTTHDVPERSGGLRALAAIGDARLPELLERIGAQHADWPPELAKSAIIYLFPVSMTVDQLLGALRGLTYRRYGAGGVSRFLPDAITRAGLSPTALETLRDGLTALVATDCCWDSAAYRVRTKRKDLVGALTRVCELQLLDLAPDGPLAESIALVLQLSRDDDYLDDESQPLRALLRNASTSLRSAVFWAQDRLLTAKMTGHEAEHRVGRILWSPSLALDAGQDLPWLEAAVDETARPAKRQLALESVIQTVRGTPDELVVLKRLRPLVADAVDLGARLEEFIDLKENPRPPQKWVVEHEKYTQERNRKQLKARASWVQFWRELSDESGARLAPERAENTAHNLAEVMSRVRGQEAYAGWNRPFLESMFTKAQVERLRNLMRGQWRKVTPTLASERSESERNVYYWSWRVGVIGIYAEAEDPLWARRLTGPEARLAMRYALTAMNGLPGWMPSLAQAHPQVVQEMLRPELDAQLRDATDHSSLLHYLNRAPSDVRDMFLDTIRGWVHEVLTAGDSKHGVDKYERATDLLLEHGTAADVDAIQAAGLKIVQTGVDQKGLLFWLPLLMRLTPEVAVAEIERLAAAVTPASLSVVTEWLSAMFGHSLQGGAVTSALLDAPELLYRLGLLAYRHIRVADDQVREGVQESNFRSGAEFARSHLAQLLLNAKGTKAWAVKLKFAEDPNVAHFKDRVVKLAAEAMAKEWDAPEFALADVASLERVHDLAPVTRADMAALLLDRLNELVDRLRRDASQRALWAKITDEYMLRRAVADEMERLANGAYSVPQESVTGEEKETDIRLESAGYPMGAVIELKVGENDYSVADLRKALRDQLVGRYMAVETRRVGCLMVSLANPAKYWLHPGDGCRIYAEEVIAILQHDADQLAAGLGYESLLVVRLLDLRPLSPAVGP